MEISARSWFAAGMALTTASTLAFAPLVLPGGERALPIVSNPLTIAEEFAMLDNLSAGRLIAGFVRGIGCEYHSTEVNPIYSHERFHEAHDLIVRAWTEPGPFAFEGEHYNFGQVLT